MNSDAQRPAALPLLRLPTHPALESDDALASILASDIENDPKGACRLIDTFCRARKCSDDFWRNVAKKMEVPDKPNDAAWTWREWIGLMCHRPDRYGMDYSLHWAVKEGNTRVIKWIIEHSNHPRVGTAYSFWNSFGLAPSREVFVWMYRYVKDHQDMWLDDSDDWDKTSREILTRAYVTAAFHGNVTIMGFLESKLANISMRRAFNTMGDLMHCFSDHLLKSYNVNADSMIRAFQWLEARGSKASMSNLSALLRDMSSYESGLYDGKKIVVSNDTMRILEWLYERKPWHTNTPNNLLYTLFALKHGVSGWARSQLIDNKVFEYLLTKLQTPDTLENFYKMIMKSLRIIAQQASNQLLLVMTSGERLTDLPQWLISWIRGTKWADSLPLTTRDYNNILLMHIDDGSYSLPLLRKLKELGANNWPEVLQKLRYWTPRDVEDFVKESADAEKRARDEKLSQEYLAHERGDATLAKPAA